MSLHTNISSTVIDRLDSRLLAFEGSMSDLQELRDRFAAEIAFALRLAERHGELTNAWHNLITFAVTTVQEGLEQGRPWHQLLTEAEALLAPIGAVAKTYTIHCVGHAHIDMNWMWNWPETVATVNDTFTTVDRLLTEFRTFRFSQSQAAIYHLAKEYLPWQYDMLQRRVAEGVWEVTAPQWVEGDKNMASGESLCRQALYAKGFFHRDFGLPADVITVDWEPDTFGHPHTLPTILAAAGVKYYYFCRAGRGPHLFWWQGKDGSRVLAFDDRRKWYCNTLDAKITTHLFDFEDETGLRDYLLVYGVGDHGGGPTREDLRRGIAMDTWPIFPRVRFSTAREFFAIVEPQAAHLPVVDGELNTIFEGCYTSQSNIKRANRRSEHALIEAEMAALLGQSLAGHAYPKQALTTAWQHTLFNQFHDILPGSGIHATYEYAQGLYQQTLAQTTAIKTHALREIASQIDTASCCPHTPLHPRDTGMRTGQGLGAGMGDIPTDGAISRRGAGGNCCDPLVIFNPTPWARREVITARIWNRAHQADELIIHDAQGTVVPAQFLDRQPYWWMSHEYSEIAFPVDIPALGYRAYSAGRQPRIPGAQRTSAPTTCHAEIIGIAKQGAETSCFSYPGEVRGLLENEHLRVEVEQISGAITHLLDKHTGIDLVPAGERLGVLEYVLQGSTGMSAWNIGQTLAQTPLLTGATLECRHAGPYLGVLRATHRFMESTMTLEIMLAAGSPCVDFTLTVNWLERGSAEKGIPSLRVNFPLAMHNGTATFECPLGHHERVADGLTVPAQRWVDLTGTQPTTELPVGATLVNADQYGFNVDDRTIHMSLLRSSYDPDPLPELGLHVFRFALHPHVGPWTPADATRAGAAFNLPLNVVNTTEQAGILPPEQAFAELLTPNVMLSGMKQAENSTAAIIRLYEMEGVACTAAMRLSPALAHPQALARQTDLLEQPLLQNTARMVDGVLCVDLPAYGLVTVMLGE